MKSSKWIGIAALAATVSAGEVAAQVQRERTGQETVQEVCIRCHGTGEQGAPRIGDTKAWKARSERGLTKLTQSAIKGVRNMPPHGARFDLSDLELERAITYMVNQSGGKWTEPVGSTRIARSGKQIVSAQCSRCHQEGKGGAPKIGDRAAWIPRLAHGFDATVSSAIHGHGGMPARGGLPDLTDGEVRAAIAYMLNPDPPASR
ncbi:MAG TPA: c-type cytochrome [Burkholderiales bacterium]|nr:c-type cytochrome [Burkholderiales bacterium]